VFALQVIALQVGGAGFGCAASCEAPSACIVSCGEERGVVGVCAAAGQDGSWRWDLCRSNYGVEGGCKQ